MAKRRVDYIDGLLEVANQIEENRGSAKAPEADPDVPLETDETEHSAERQQATKHEQEVQHEGKAEGLGQVSGSEDQGVVRAKPVRTDSKRTPYIRIEDKRLYVIRSQSGQVQSIDWRAMGPRLPRPVVVQDRFYAMDNEVDDLLMPDLDLIQQAVYRFLYRSSYGWGRCVCASSFEAIQKGTGIKSRVTVQKAIDSLRELGCIAIEYEKSPVTPRVYRVYLPCEIKAYEGKSKRSESIRSESIRTGNSDALAQKMNVSASGNKRIENERVSDNEAASWDDDEARDGGNAPKYSNKNSNDKNSSNRKDALLLLFSSHNLRINQGKLDEWAADELLELTQVENYITWVAGKAARGECKDPVRFLVTAIDERWPMDSDVPDSLFAGREAHHPIQVVDHQAEEDEAVKAHIAAMTPDKLEALQKQALACASEDWVYKRATTEKARDGVVMGKMMEIIRKALRETATTVDRT